MRGEQGDGPGPVGVVVHGGDPGGSRQAQVVVPSLHRLGGQDPQCQAREQGDQAEREQGGTEPLHRSLPSPGPVDPGCLRGISAAASGY